MIKIILQYIAVGLTFVPWGALYAILSLAGWDHWLILIIILSAGCLTAYLVWTKLEKLLTFKSENVFQIFPWNSSGQVGRVFGTIAQPVVASVSVGFFIYFTLEAFSPIIVAENKPKSTTSVSSITYFSEL